MFSVFLSYCGILETPEQLLNLVRIILSCIIVVVVLEIVVNARYGVKHYKANGNDCPIMDLQI